MREAFGIYVHWPFCAAKCPYCDFNSHVRIKPVDQPRFAKAFLQELAYYRQNSGQRTVSSIFFGGGTPSLMEPQTVATLLDGINHHYNIDENVEITLEANPSSVEANRFNGYRKAGVNRLSLGVQALDDLELKRLGRLHNVKQAIEAIELARKIFPRLSFDLIYARPNQTIQSWQKELHQAIDLAADHLSLYQLTIEEGTAFQKLYDAGRLIMPKDELAAELYEITQNITSARGLPAYEISNHAKKGAESQHNLLYWRYQPYIGLGPGAHGRFSNGRFSNHNNTDVRYVTINEKNPEKWLERVEKHQNGCVEEEFLNHHQQADELVIMGMRLYEGLDITRYEKIAKRPIKQNAIIKLQKEGLVEMVDNVHLRATKSGRIILNQIISTLVE